MLQYHSILGSKQTPLGFSGEVFYKYDGSNIRFEFNHKTGWSKFGSRTQMIDEKTQLLGQSIALFRENIEETLNDILKQYLGKNYKNTDKITVFCEFFGPHSFAGYHDESDQFELKLFDIYLSKKGFIIPKDFIEITKNHSFAAKHLFSCNFNQELIEKVRKNECVGRDDKAISLDEGIIFKGVAREINKHGNHVWMSKIKTQDYLDKLKSKFNDKWTQFAE